jgi:hypothetical protein
MSAKGRVYFEEREGNRLFDDLAVVSEVRFGRKLLRHVRAARQSWTEEFR